MKLQWRAKTTWAGFALVVTGIGELISEGGDRTQGIIMVVNGLGLVFLREAIAKNGFNR